MKRSVALLEENFAMFLRHVTSFGTAKVNKTLHSRLPERNLNESSLAGDNGESRDSSAARSSKPPYKTLAELTIPWTAGAPEFRAQRFKPRRGARRAQGRGADPGASSRRSVDLGGTCAPRGRRGPGLLARAGSPLGEAALAYSVAALSSREPGS